MAGDTTEELERFRRQWYEEVTARSKGASFSSGSKTARAEQKIAGAGSSHAPPTLRIPHKEPREANDGSGTHPSTRREPTSALEHYERAVERETEGNLGDSLGHYRKAYRVRHSS